MTTLGAIRTAVADTVTEAINAQSQRKLTAYPRVPGSPNLPALVVLPADADFNRAMGRGLTTVNFRLILLVSLRDFDLGQNELDDYVADAGPKSIREIIWNRRDLGLRDGAGNPEVDAHVSGMSNYGGQFDTVGIDHLGAELALVVHTDGRG